MILSRDNITPKIRSSLLAVNGAIREDLMTYAGVQIHGGVSGLAASRGYGAHKQAHPTRFASDCLGYMLRIWSQPAICATSRDTRFLAQLDRLHRRRPVGSLQPRSQRPTHSPVVRPRILPFSHRLADSRDKAPVNSTLSASQSLLFGSTSSRSSKLRASTVPLSTSTGE